MSRGPDSALRFLSRNRTVDFNTMDLLTLHQQKALNFKEHISLTANAGSGKTFVLSRRYLEIALSEQGSLRKIAAITFTDKAAGELYKKIAELVENRYNDSDNEEDRKLLSKIRRQLVSANISTIHSFCTDILRQFPVEAGLDANFQPIDEITSDELIELSVDEIIKESLSDGIASEDTKYLIRFFRSRYTFALQLRALIKNRKKVFELRDTIYSQEEEDIADFFYESFINTAEKLIQLNQNTFIDAFNRINDTVLSAKPENETALLIRSLLERMVKAESVEEKISIISSIRNNAFTKKGEVRKTGYLTTDLREGLSAEILSSEQNVKELSALDVPADHKEAETALAKFGIAVLRLFDLAVGRYELKKKENSYLDYEDILILTRNLLQIDPVKAELSRKFKYIMVDEYQDTNEIQYKIFLPILDDLREGNLFVVGDEKQSIYMFRDADLEVFRITKEKISGTSGEKYLLSLPDSFRMAPGICLFVNKLFRNLFSNPSELFNEVEHTDLVCAKSKETDSQIEILIGASEKDEGADNTNELSEAGLVAGKIISLVKDTSEDKNLSWKDIAVLVRKRKSFSSLEKIFTEKNIPFNIVGGKGFYQRQPVYDIYNYFSFLLDTNNNAALVGILRSPFFSLPDSIIYEISLGEGETLWQKLNDYKSGDKRIINAVKLLKDNIQISTVYTISQILRKILSESPFLSVLAQKASGAQEAANISKLVKLTIDFQKRGFKTLYDYVNFLKESIEGLEDESQAALADESDSVKVMTLHQAKGLEYPAVFLYNAHETTSSDKVKKGNIQIDRHFGLLTKVPLNDDYFSDYQSVPVNNVFDIISLRKESAELKRLFYVGATRAKNYLFITAPELDKYKSGSFMSLLQEGLNIDFDGDSFSIKDELQFLNTDGNQFVNQSETIEEEIKIIKGQVESSVKGESKSDKEEINRILVAEIKDVPSGEIISASKFAAFKQCPLKYRLTYELGLSGLAEDYNRYLNEKLPPGKNRYDFSYKEDFNEDQNEEGIRVSAQLKGSIIHKVLQKNEGDISNDEIALIIKEELNFKRSDIIETLSVDIFNHLKHYFESDIFKSITRYKNYYNEHEIYTNEKDYFLHGIIDKLIINDKKAIILDYKTDSIQREEIFDRAELYFPQLKFYSYIISRFFEELTSFELRLIFISFPDVDVKENISRDEAVKTGNEIRKMVKHLRLREFEKNLSHCSECSFGLTNSKCIVGRA